MDATNNDCLLTIGEAAELAGVALLDLREHIRAGRLATVRAQRLGDELPLVSRAALAQLYPAAGRRKHRPLRSLAERGIRVIDESVPLELPQPVDVSPGLPKAQRKTEVAEPEAEAEDKVLPGVALEVELLERQIASLRTEVNHARNRNQSLLEELDGASAEAQRVLDDTQGPAIRRRRNRDRAQREQQELDAALSGFEQQSSFGAGTWIAASVAVIAGVALVLWARSPVYAAPVAPDEPALDQAALRESSVVRSLLASARMERRRSTRPKRNESSELVAPAGMEDEPETMAESAETEAQRREERRRNRGAAQEAAQQLEELIGEDPAGESEGGKALVSSGDPCEMYPLTGPGQPMREILGPCMGPWNPAERSVVGVHRQNGKSWCRHHDMIAQELGGSIVRAKEIAEFAASEGLVPPLVQLRVDRAAAKALSLRAPGWIESGFEAGSPADHKATRLVGRDRWRLESWVRIAGDDGKVRRRTFRMQLELNDTDVVDRELEFTWLDE